MAELELRKQTCAASLHLLFVSQAVGRMPNVECHSRQNVSNGISIYNKIQF